MNRAPRSSLRALALLALAAPLAACPGDDPEPSATEEPPRPRSLLTGLGLLILGAMIGAAALVLFEML